MKVLLWLIGVPLAVFVVLVIVGAAQDAQDPRSAWQRIEDACNEEFKGRGELIVNDCKIRVGAKQLITREQEALSRADRKAR